MMIDRAWFRLGFACCVAVSSGFSGAWAAGFVLDGQLVVADAATSRVVELSGSGARSVGGEAERVSKYWGALGDGRLLVTLEHSHEAVAGTANAVMDAVDEAVPGHTCSTSSPGEAAVLVNADGSRGAAVCPDVLRAYPAPVGNRIAIISPERDLQLWDDGELTTVTAPGRVSNAGWSPDGQRLVVSVYPPDWSEGAVSSALTTAEFLRLQNADLYLYDVARGEFVSHLTDNPGTEYGAFFSEDGRSLFYIWLHLTEDIGGLMRMELDLDDRTSASTPALQLTQAGEDIGETPLGRVGTYVWTRDNNQLVFEAGRPDGSGVIWAMAANGQAAVAVAAGRTPQRLSDREVIFQDGLGAIQVATPEVQP